MEYIAVLSYMTDACLRVCLFGDFWTFVFRDFSGLLYIAYNNKSFDTEGANLHTLHGYLNPVTTSTTNL